MIIKKRVFDSEEWHKWFAWFPVRINDNEMVWLEMVERRLIIGEFDSSYEYKLIYNGDKNEF